MDVFKILNNEKYTLCIASMPHKDNIEEDLLNLKKYGTQIILCSLLTNDEVLKLQLQTESHICKKNNIEFLHLQVVDQSIPGYNEFKKLIRKLLDKYNNQHTIIIHCKHGIGRSGMIASAMLLHLGYSLDKACKFISDKRGYTVPQSKSQFKLLNYYYKDVIGKI